MWYTRVVIAGQNSGGIKKMPLDIPISNTLKEILSQLAAEGKRGLIVGGAVRDAVLGQIPKDIDVEVYGTSFPELAKLLSAYGHVIGASDEEGGGVVGKAFGVIKFRDPMGNDYDFSLPRRDSKTGEGHTGFDIQVDPSMTPQEAASRRDFTFNSLAFDPLTSDVHDYYGGLSDLQNGILRATDPEKFGEDPLRVLRGMQFAARMGLVVEPMTAELARQLADRMPELYRSETNPGGISRERVTEEFKKLVTKGKKPGSMIQYLIDTGWIRYFPEIAAIVGVPQDPDWHPEGDVHIHTAHVMDAAAEIADREGLTGDDRAVLIYAALGHDFAKATHTEQREKGGRLRWTAHGHEAAGGPLVHQFLKSIGERSSVIRRVVPIVERHLEHINHKGPNISKGAIRKLARELGSGTIRDLALLMEADASGRPPLEKQMPEGAAWLLEAAKADGVHDKQPPKLIQGRHVLPFYQGKAGPHIGQAVEAAYNAYIQGKWHTEEEGVQWVKDYIQRQASLLRGDHILPYFGGRGGPYVKDILNEAWEAQNAGAFTDEPTALQWLDQRMNSAQ